MSMMGSALGFKLEAGSPTNSNNSTPNPFNRSKISVPPNGSSATTCPLSSMSPHSRYAATTCGPSVSYPSSASPPLSILSQRTPGSRNYLDMDSRLLGQHSEFTRLRPSSPLPPITATTITTTTTRASKRGGNRNKKNPIIVPSPNSGETSGFRQKKGGANRIPGSGSSVAKKAGSSSIKVYLDSLKENRGDNELIKQINTDIPKVDTSNGQTSKDSLGEVQELRARILRSLDNIDKSDSRQNRKRTAQKPQTTPLAFATMASQLPPSDVYSSTFRKLIETETAMNSSSLRQEITGHSAYSRNALLLLDKSREDLLDCTDPAFITHSGTSPKIFNINDESPSPSSTVPLNISDRKNQTLFSTMDINNDSGNQAVFNDNSTTTSLTSTSATRKQTRHRQKVPKSSLEILDSPLDIPIPGAPIIPQLSVCVPSPLCIPDFYEEDEEQDHFRRDEDATLTSTFIPTPAPASAPISPSPSLSLPPSSDPFYIPTRPQPQPRPQEEPTKEQVHRAERQLGFICVHPYEDVSKSMTEGDVNGMERGIIPRAWVDDGRLEAQVMLGSLRGGNGGVGGRGGMGVGVERGRGLGFTLLDESEGEGGTEDGMLEGKGKEIEDEDEDEGEGEGEYTLDSFDPVGTLSDFLLSVTHPFMLAWKTAYGR